MIIYLFRHAQAEPGMGSDFSRELTERGRSRTQTAARVLERLGVNLSHLYTSPRIRALQTAEILSKTLGVPFEQHDGLDFGFDIDVVDALIRGRHAAEDIMLVGHEPSMSTVLRLMTGTHADMKKGGMARIDLPVYTSLPRGELIWLIAPKVFDALEA